ncbi:MAG: tetratricopeptide repeat protein [Chlamydiota bacterium]
MFLSDIKNRFNDVVNALVSSSGKEEIEDFFNSPSCVKEHLNLTELDVKELSEESILYCKHGNWEKALESLGWLTFLDPSNAFHFLRLGSILLRIEQYAEALRILKVGSALDSDNPEFFLYMGSCYLGLGEKEQAKESFQTTLWLSKNNPDHKEIFLLAEEAILI